MPCRRLEACATMLSATSSTSTRCAAPQAVCTECGVHCKTGRNADATVRLPGHAWWQIQQSPRLCTHACFAVSSPFKDPSRPCPVFRGTAGGDWPLAHGRPSCKLMGVALQICTFLTAYQLLHDGNRLAVLAACDTGVRCLFSDLNLLPDPAAAASGTAAAVAVASQLSAVPGACHAAPTRAASRHDAGKVSTWPCTQVQSTQRHRLANTVAWFHAPSACRPIVIYRCGPSEACGNGRRACTACHAHGGTCYNLTPCSSMQRPRRASRAPQCRPQPR